MNDTPLRSIEEVQKLTQEYASYSQSKNGLGNVLGGVAGLAIVFANGVIGPGLLTAILTIGFTICWLVGKEVIRRKVYRSFGEARELWSPAARRWHRWAISFLILVVIVVWIIFIAFGGLAKPQGWLYLLFVASMPWIAWRYLRTTSEFVVGVFFLCACAVTSMGAHTGSSAGGGSACSR
ncbi:hypothetical protein [Dictyobacter kobayashii]|uniref:Uncharacterized protein n=1 Tax=Dictyobacter kobayashii TaxID=2014872 RepID=A0A402APZ3_9CHLR|nr:hypothetical protein [Dictyobacter kobayashii]GCE21060.1 hypothetical protein KDK_48600 [Dictyobacter kobayashii]